MAYDAKRRLLSCGYCDHQMWEYQAVMSGALATVEEHDLPMAWQTKRASVRKLIPAISLFGVAALFCVSCAVTTPAPPTRPALPPAVEVAPTLTVVPSPAPTPVLPTPAIPPMPDLDPASYRPAMRPEFAADVDSLGDVPRYFITLTVDPDALQATGRERVRYTNTDATALSQVYFRLFPSAPGYGGAMTVTRVLVGGQPVTIQLEQQSTALNVPVSLAPGASADFLLDFQVGIPRDSTVGYAMFGSTEGVLALPNFYPVIPARDESGWHIEVAPDYGDETFNPTALYDVSITAPAAQVVVTSGTCKSEAGVWHCVSGPMRDFMLAMSADYQSVTKDMDGVTIRSFYRPGSEAGGDRALQVAADALRVYSRRFGPYPFAELDVLETPTRAGGIEYPGLVVIASTLYDQRAGEGDYFDFVVAHEVAHQWWYSLVGDDQVNHPWLDESLAGYSTLLYYEDTYGKAIANQVLQQVFEEPYQKLLQDKRDQKVDQPVSAFTQSDYSTVVYRKGPLFFKALRDAIGDDKFNAFLKTYFRQNRYGIATPERMLAAAESVADKSTVRSLFDKWIESATKP